MRVILIGERAKHARQYLGVYKFELVQYTYIYLCMDIRVP